jgi:Ribosomal RNA adenine dimethylase
MMTRMLRDDDFESYADLGLEQHFLVDPAKLSALVAAAGVIPTDRVVEVGAGVGTVATKIRECASLTLVELDARLTARLRRNMPNADIVQADALELLPKIPFDVLISNLPNSATESLLEILPRLTFRTAVIAVGEASDLDRLGPRFEWSEVTRTWGDDFRPPQPSVSRVVRVVPAMSRVNTRSPDGAR